MPIYEYGCGSCRQVFEISHGMFEKPRVGCTRCGRRAKRLLSAPGLKLGNWSSPTAARYAKTTAGEEIAREREQQKGYDKIWLPDAVKHNPWNGSS